MTRSVLYDLFAAAAHRLEPALASLWRWCTRVTARDETEVTASRRCVVIAPHPDDETIGCGATIARKRAAGTPVTVVIVADGRYAQPRSQLVSAAELATIRAAEAQAACAHLGVEPDRVVQLGFEDNHVSGQEHVLAERLLQELVHAQPDEVLVVSGVDHHPDHRAVHRAAHMALDRWGEEVVVREFAVWSWIDGPWLDQRDRSPVGRVLHLLGQPFRLLLRGRATAVSTEGYSAAKRAALAAHASQVSSYTGEPEWAVMDDELLSVFPDDVEIFLPVTSRNERRRLCSTTS